MFWIEVQISTLVTQPTELLALYDTQENDQSYKITT